MADKRTVDDLTIEELERVLAIRKRDARAQRLDRMKNNGRVIDTAFQAAPTLAPVVPSLEMMDEVLSGSPRYIESSAIPPERRKTKRTQDSIWRRFVDRSLLMVEVVAVLGLFAVGAVLLSGITQLQEESAQVQRDAQLAIRASQPTLAPTPTLQLANIVLPGGHTPPNEVGGGQFNFNEIPANLRAQFNDQIFLPPTISRPAPLPETPLRVIIPDLNIDESIVQGVDWEALKLGVGQLTNGATPTDADANIVLAAHNDIYGQLFRYLDRLEPGMILRIQTQTRLYEYVITGYEVVNPDDVHVMQPRGVRAVTLISCYPYQVNNKRYIVYAEQVTS